MYDETVDLIEKSRLGIRTYTNKFTGDIGRKFKRVDEILERPLDAIETDEYGQYPQVRLRTDLGTGYGVTPGLRSVRILYLRPSVRRYFRS